MTPITGLAKETGGLTANARTFVAAAKERAVSELFSKSLFRPRAFAFAMMAIALWFAFHPYRGVVHDGRLYAIQALNALNPERYASDLYFRFGSQDAFTSFSLLYRPLVAALGVATAHHLATLVGELAWLGCLFLLVRALLPNRREALFALVAAIAACPEYGGFFEYGETVATPRLFAEALIMGALTLAATRRWALVCATLLAAAAVHPIMALTGAAAVGLWRLEHDRRLLLLSGAAAALALALALILGALSVQPFVRLFQSFDAEWFEVVRQRCALGLLTRWYWSHYVSIGVTLSLAAVSLWWKEDRALRSLALACALASVLGLTITFVGGDLGHNVLVVNAQPWRCLWLSRLMANIILGVLAFRAPREGLSRALLLIALILSALTRFRLCLSVIADVAVLAAVGCYWLETRSKQPVHPWIRWVFLTLLGVAAASPAFFASIRVTQPGFLGELASPSLGAAIFGLLSALDRGRLRIAAATTAAGVALGAALLLNDQTSDWQKFLDQPGAPADLIEFAGGKSNLYWDDSPEIFWFKLEKPSYYSCLQGTGAMFYRETALEYARRSRALARLNTHDFSNGGWICNQKAEPEAESPKSLEDIREACRELPELDGVVLTVAVPGAPAERWAAPADKIYVKPPESDKISAYYKYDCQAFR